MKELITGFCMGNQELILSLHNVKIRNVKVSILRRNECALTPERDVDKGIVSHICDVNIGFECVGDSVPSTLVPDSYSIIGANF